VLVVGCGVGSNTVVSGKSDQAGVIFFDNSSYGIDVTIDNKHYKVNTVKNSDFKKKRNIKKTAENIIVVRPGAHDVMVRDRGRVILTQKIFVSAGDTKVINL
ncbi:MAG: hypothetical protein II064_04115, partial [Bacteroidales bacterium]|nr:hypothetical protein [Bacteroidales bacterium]